MKTDIGAFTLEPLGALGWVIRSRGNDSPARLAACHALASALRHRPIPGQCDVIPSYETVTVHLDPRLLGFPALRPEELREEFSKRIPNLTTSENEASGRTHAIPVRWGGDFGPDLAESARHCGFTPEAYLARLQETTFTVATVGFSPGFPYLVGLPPELAVPRRSTPRLRVPAGSVAIGGQQAGIYSLETPGGWNLLGRTATELFYPHRSESPCLFFAGDRVRFVTAADSAAPPVLAASEQPPASSCEVELLSATGGTTVQDLGRLGWQHHGVTPSGAADRDALIRANLLLGNPAGAAALETYLVAPSLRFHLDTWVCLTGARCAGRENDRPLRVKAGEVLTLGPLLAGSRMYIAFAGGLLTPLTKGCRATQKAVEWAGVPYPLPRGYKLTVGRATRLDVAADTITLLSKSEAQDKPVHTLRFTPGAHWGRFPADVQREFLQTDYLVSAKSDRMGLRLEGPALPYSLAPLPPSEGVATGLVQLPPDGRPIVLLTERQTLGGYAKLAQVDHEDLGRLGQLRPGERVRFALTEVPRVVLPAHWRQRQGLRGHPRTPVCTIDLNVDLGEGSPHEEALFALATSCSIACGGHAGDDHQMRHSLRQARHHGLAVGAHPSYEDRENFGRRETGASVEDLRRLLLTQVRRLDALAREEGVVLTHVKPHGALYHRFTQDPEATRVLLDCLTHELSGLWLFALAGSPLVAAARRAGVPVVSEGFIDRGYTREGKLQPRSEPGAVLENLEEAISQALGLVRQGQPNRAQPLAAPLSVQSLCTHGDGPQAAHHLGEVRRALLAAGIQLCSYLD